MNDRDRDLERRLRAHYGSMPEGMPDELRGRVRGQIRSGRGRQSTWWAGVAAAAVGALSLGILAVVVTGELVPTSGPSASDVASVAPPPTGVQTAEATLAATYRARDVLVVSGDGLGEPIEAYRGDRLYVADVVQLPDGPAYRLEGPPRSAQEDAARVELPAALVETSTERTTVACPEAPETLSELDTVRPFERFVCFGESTLTLRDVWVGGVIMGRPAMGPEPFGRLSRFEEVDSGWLPFSVDEGTVVPVGWSTVTGSFGQVDASCGDWVGQLACRERFVVESVSAGKSPFTELHGTWARMSEAPIAGRSSYVALDIGDGTFIWAGDGEEPEGAIYRASDDTWTTVALPPDLAPRYRPAAVWTGDQVLIWGGNDDPEGLRYDPGSDAWAVTPTAPIDPGYPVGAWTGVEFIVVTGATQAAAWNPASATWRLLPDAPLPEGYLESVWTGQELIVLGLTEGGTDPLIGAALDPVSGTWRPIAEVPYDGLALGIRPVWTGTEMLFAGHAYDPMSDRWRPLSIEGCRVGDVSSGVWTGRWVISQVQAYDPSTGRCQQLPPGPPRPDFDVVGATHEFHTPAWDEGRLVVWSGGTGLDGPGSPADGIVFTPDQP